MILKRLLNSINRNERNNINDNWETIEKTYTKIEETADEAKTKADDAVTTAGTAKFTAETVETEFNRIVAEAGSNNPEVVQARGDFVNLNERLNIEIGQVTEGLAQTNQKTDELILVESFRLDGEIDDTEKLKRAIAFCKNNGLKRLCITRDCVISEPVIVDAPFLTIYGDTKNDKMPKISSSNAFMGDSLLNIKAQGVSFDSICIDGDNDLEMVTGALTGIRYDFDKPDCDSYISNCKIQYLKYGVVVYGRNVKILDNVFMLTNFPITLYKYNGVNALYGSDLRGFEFKRNEFHSCGQPSTNMDFACLLTVNDCTENQEIEFSDNSIEQGVNRLFKGYHHGLRFNNNKTTSTAFTFPIALELWTTPAEITKIRYTEIIGNTVHGGTSGEAEVLNFIKVTGYLKFCNIEENIVNVTTKEAIIINGFIENSRITNNTFMAQSYKYPNVHNAIDIKGNVVKSIITDNSFHDTFYKHAIFIQGNISRSFIDDNLFDSNHSGVKVMIQTSPGGKFYKTFDGTNISYESCDTRNAFAGSVLSVSNFKRLNPENGGVLETIASESVEVDSFSDVTKQNGRRIYSIRNEGSLKETFRLDKDGAMVSGYFRIGLNYLWVDVNGKLRIKSSKPVSDTDGTVVGSQT